MTRKLTLNRGIRWEPYLPLHERNNRLTALHAGQQSTVYPTASTGLVFPGDAGVPDAIIDPEWGNSAPRFGFAYDPFGAGRTSIRGGYDILYHTAADALQLVSESPAILSRNNTPDSVQSPDPYRGASNITTALQTYIGGVPAGATDFQFVTSVTASTIDPGFTNGYMQQWNCNIQREVGKAFVATASYVGSKGTHLQIPEEITRSVRARSHIRQPKSAATVSAVWGHSGARGKRKLYVLVAAADA